MNKFKYFILLILPYIAIAQQSQRFIHSNWKFHQIGKEQWIPAKVPGSVITDLYVNKMIPDPLYAANEKKIQWVEKEDWEYSTEFICSSRELATKNIELKFEGLDTYAKVFLNNQLILQADNMFRTWDVDVKKILKLGNNILTVQFSSPIKIAQSESKKLNYTLPDDERVFTRKAAYQYGWDFAPRIINCGIWKPVHLCFYDDVSIVHEYVSQNLKDSVAELNFNFTIHSDVKSDFVLTISDATDAKKIFASQHLFTQKGDSILSVSFQINHPKLWWCNGYGEPSLYHFISTIKKSNVIIEQKATTIGIRKVELIREKDKIGESFYFKLNGVSVFMKGANVVPQNAIPSDVTKKDDHNIIQSVVEANMNMLRVWGGGIYPDDEFYNQCDENGILVWQDLMFAGAMYPGDLSFTENVKEEIKQQVFRLRNHPSLALWCGNNEINEGWKNWGWQKQYHISAVDSGVIWNDYVSLFENSIPEIVSENDDNRIFLYWPSSPSIGWGHKESLLSGDAHYWGVWWGNEKFDAYKNHVGRFMSEYGFQSMPSINSLRKMVDSNDLNFGSEALKNHQKNTKGFDNMQAAIMDEYKPTVDFEKHVLLSQLVQANGLKTAIEAHRRAKPDCMGTLFWQLNDCWPSVSWSAIDYYGNRKASYYQAKRSFAKLIISFNDYAEGIQIHVVSDDLKTVPGKLEIRLYDLNGKLLWWESSSSIKFLPNYSGVCYVFEKRLLEKYNKNEIVLSCSIVTDDKTELANSLYYFSKEGDLLLPKPTFKLLKIGEHSFSISTDVFAKDICIHLKSSDLNLSDNYFDLVPGKEKIIKMEDGKSFSDIESHLIITSLFDLL